MGASTLRLTQADDTRYAGRLSGSGRLVKSGVGRLALGGTGDFSGILELVGGGLAIDGQLDRANLVAAGGAVLSGGGTLGDVRLVGAVLDVGAGIATLRVVRDLVLDGGSSLNLTVDAAGRSGRVSVGGRVELGGAALSVLADDGRYRGATRYRIVQADGGLTGQFGTVATNFAFLTPRLDYDARGVALTLLRNDTDFASLGRDTNQVAVGAALAALGPGNPLFEETLTLSRTAVADSLGSLAADIRPNLDQVALQEGRLLNRALTDLPAPDRAGLFGWATAYAASVSANGSVFGDGLEGSTRTLVTGLGLHRGAFTARLGAAIGGSDYAGLDEAEASSRAVVGTLRYDAGRFYGLVGGTYGWTDVGVTRTTALGQVGGVVHGEQDVDVRQLFAEVGASFDLGGVGIDPFIGVTSSKLSGNAERESGGATALAIDGITRDLTFVTLGARLTPLSMLLGRGLALRPTGSAAYRRTSGERTAARLVRFDGTDTPFLTASRALSRDALELSGGLSLGGPRWSVGVDYIGALSDSHDVHGGRIRMQVRF